MFLCFNNSFYSKCINFIGMCVFVSISLCLCGSIKPTVLLCKPANSFINTDINLRSDGTNTVSSVHNLFSYAVMLAYYQLQVYFTLFFCWVKTDFKHGRWRRHLFFLSFCMQRLSFSVINTIASQEWKQEFLDSKCPNIVTTTVQLNKNDHFCMKC